MGQFSAARAHGIGLPLSSEEVVEMQMIIQDEDAEAALDFVRRLRKKVREIESRHCGDPDSLTIPKG